jgi:hypothetical protein
MRGCLVIQTCGFVFLRKPMGLQVEEILTFPGTVVILLPGDITLGDLLQPICS